MTKNQHFGCLLRIEREKLGLAQSELAKKSDLTTHCVSLFESGQQIPTFFALCRLANGLDMSMEELLY
ncbi:MAG: helix-turn-helix domain-containing protein [Fibromonadales bacterium]|nr:helix-turn-helix domain-containing protein [Fibromonadales bacterium]